MAGIVVGSVGLVGLAVAGALGGVALSQSSSAKSQCPTLPCSNKSAIDSENSAGSLADGSTAMFVVGGAALAAGIITLVTAPSAKRAAASPGSGSVRPRLSPWMAPAIGRGVAGLSAGMVFR